MCQACFELVLHRNGYRTAFGMAVPSRLTSLEPVLVVKRNGHYIGFTMAVPGHFTSLEPLETELVLYRFYYGRAKPFDLS